MIGRLRQSIHQYQRELAETITQLESTRQDLSSARSRLSSTEAELASERAELAWARNQLESTTVLLEEREAHLHRIYSSLGWRLLSKYGAVKNGFLLPAIDKIRGWFEKASPRPPLESVAAGSSQETGHGIPLSTRLDYENRAGEDLQSSLKEEPACEATDYQKWISLSTVVRVDRATAEERVAAFSLKPVISIVMPVFDPRPEFLKAAIESVSGQFYPSWNLCICCNDSTGPEGRKILHDSSSGDTRISVVHRAENDGLAAASNAALALAKGEFVGFLSQDDQLSCDALYEIVSTLNQTALQHTEPDLIYSDEDCLDMAAVRGDPSLKPRWSPDLLLSFNYIGQFAVYRKGILNAIGGLREGFDTGQAHDLNLRFTEQTSRIVHIPRILYHRRKYPVSCPDSSRAMPCVNDAGLDVLRDAMSRRHIDGTVEPAYSNGSCRLRRTILGSPRVTIIIPTRDSLDLLVQCLDSIEALTGYPDYEILIVDNGSTSAETLLFLEQTRHRVLRDEGDFNYSRLSNFAAREASGEYLLLLNNDTEVISPDWISAMVEQAQRPEVGAVGAKLIYPDYKLQHAGIVLGMPRLVSHIHRFASPDSTGYINPANVIRDCGAVTGACMMIRRELYNSMGGLNEDLRIAFNDVDLCLRLREKGHLVVFTPFAILYHHESATRAPGWDEAEASYMLSRWPWDFLSDPYSSPNLDLNAEGCAPDVTKPESSVCFCVQYEWDEPGFNLAEVVAGQYVRLVCGNLCGIALSFATREGTPRGMLRLCLARNQESEPVRTIEFDASSIRNGEFHRFFFKPVHASPGTEFYFSIEFTSDEDAAGAPLRVSKYSKPLAERTSGISGLFGEGIGQLYLDNIPVQGTLALELFRVQDYR